jgi:hypothetical protein
MKLDFNYIILSRIFVILKTFACAVLQVVKGLLKTQLQVKLLQELGMP